MKTKSASSSLFISTIGRIPRQALQLAGWLFLRFAGRLLGASAGAIARRCYFLPPPRTLLSPEGAAPFRFRSRGLVVQGYSRGLGPVALLLHGWGGYAAQFDPLAAELVRAGHRVVSLDLPGHGRSGGTLASLLHFADAVGEAEKLIGPIATLVAHSLGGGAAALALSRGLPVRRVVLISPFARFDSFLELFSRAHRLSPRTRTALVQDGERWLGAPFDEITPIHFAPRLHVPALVIHSDDDRITSVAESRELAAAWPAAEHATVSRLGHLRVLRDPGVHQRVLDFLAIAPGAAGESRDRELATSGTR